MFDKLKKKSYTEETGIENTEGLISFEDPSGLKLRVRPTHVGLHCTTTDEYGYDAAGKFGIVEKGESFVHKQPAYEVSIDLNGKNPEEVIAKLNAVPRGGFADFPEKFILANQHIIPLGITEKHVIFAPAMFDKIHASGLFQKATIQKIADVIFDAKSHSTEKSDSTTGIADSFVAETAVNSAPDNTSANQATSTVAASTMSGTEGKVDKSPKSQKPGPFTK